MLNKYFGGDGTLKYICCGFTEKNTRKINMDRIYYSKKRINGKNTFFAVICDGVGSLEHGAYASQSAIEFLKNWFKALNTLDSVGAQLVEVVSKLNEEIVESSRKNHIKTATTLSAIIMYDNLYFTAHIGDTRIYCYDNDFLKILSTDMISDTGKLTDYIGIKEKIYTEYRKGFTDGKIFLLCSDGLYQKISIHAVMASSKTEKYFHIRKIAKLLLKSAIENGSTDNASIIIVKAV